MKKCKIKLLKRIAIEKKMCYTILNVVQMMSRKFKSSQIIQGFTMKG